MKLSTLPPFDQGAGQDFDGTYEVIDETQLIVAAAEMALQAINSADQMTIDALRIAADVQAWAMKPEQFGGMASTETIADATLEKIKHTPHASGVKTATYRLEPANGCRTEPAIPSNKPVLLYINGHDAQTNIKVCVGIAGQATADCGYVVEP